MYGIINQGLKDMICLEQGVDVWRQVCESIGLSSEDFETLRSYDDSCTYQLIQAIATTLQVSQDDVLVRYGHYWVSFTAKRGYGPIMDLFGRDFRTCLKNLNRMHTHMGAMMPKLNPPRFEVHEVEERVIEVHYTSSRAGLVPMVQGLLQGLAEKFNEQVVINLQSSSSSQSSATFLLSFAAS